MKISTRKELNFQLVQIEGDIVGEENGTQIMESADNALINKKHCIMDIEHVRFINSSGIGVLITLMAKFEKIEKKLVLVKPSSHVMKLLTIIKLQNTFHIADSVEQAEQTL